MTWDTLHADRVHFGAEQKYLQKLLDEGRTFEEIADGDITTIELAAAKDEMLADIEKATGYDPDDAEDLAKLDEMVDGNQRLLKRALAYKQLVLVFRQTEKGAESREYAKLMYYDDLYETERKGFRNLKLDEVNPGATVQTVTIRM